MLDMLHLLTYRFVKKSIKIGKSGEEAQSGYSFR